MRSIGTTTDDAAMVGSGSCNSTACGSGSSGGGIGVTGGDRARGGGADVGNLVGVGELPPRGDDPEVELRENHGSRKRLANRGRSCSRDSRSGSKLRGCLSLQRALGDRRKKLAILAIVMGTVNTLDVFNTDLFP